ncbi:HAD superfamily hydrolase (TIGR01509 family)/HAD superfamily hydrolase (TIGR01549 family) [Tamaricihabitans halophyticus]|uniref:HAD superfamily hydrolase (TIGR01509 family)/HAD superfamily hydrolase (TIGR01549 family) n=1 Tax=Tamaricihabitans halophyticus TaxID=1262583 RepID=A0A4R2R3S4_9PSEU|nr:HAD family hydrolase [Tamaricihabitans halophyticus]TCP56524.1 HAD superfamily hydrolase (TIGR01509 family)/HAD superfamily hydrolase (TIGR01549 family) [Tamaricihabitans halophyticus]
MTVRLRAVVFDWRGTLVTTLDERGWVHAALHRIGRAADEVSVAEVCAAIASASGSPDRLDAPGIDSDALLHRDTYYAVFADAGLDDELADALYAVESDPVYNEFAVDALEVLAAVSGRGCAVAVLSDIHFDLRPAFVAGGLDQFVDAYVLSYERGVQKPDPSIFRIALAMLGTESGQTLMVGDRASHDGAAVELGMPTLLLPPLTDAQQRRLHLVRNLTG